MQGTAQEGVSRPVPYPTTLTEPFWQACRDGRLIVQRCADCGRYVFTPQAFCRYCLGPRLGWVASAGIGVIVTYTVVWRPQTPAFVAPYVVAVVRVDEGYELITNIVGSAAAEVSIGARVRVRFVPLTQDISLPCFELVA